MSQNNQNKAEGEIISILSVIPQLKVTRFEIEKNRIAKTLGLIPIPLVGRKWRGFKSTCATHKIKPRSYSMQYF